MTEIVSIDPSSAVELLGEMSDQFNVLQLVTTAKYGLSFGISHTICSVRALELDENLLRISILQGLKRTSGRVYAFSKSAEMLWQLSSNPDLYFVKGKYLHAVKFYRDPPDSEFHALSYRFAVITV